ncbi:MAG: translocation/assembly module TamB domain-containing protein, partial [Acidobacteria bacterium]|nr:translocation/assembly module TamB domain-containing protein [Acidobacteriota bacterium]
TYRYAPLGVAGTTPRHRLDTRYRGVDLGGLSALAGLDGMDVAGRADGHHLLEFTSGQFDRRTGNGEMLISAPDGQRMQGRDLIELPAPRAAGVGARLDRDLPLGRVPIAAELHYRYQGAWLDLDRSYVSTPETYVEFSGRTQSGEASDVAFHVTSRDWQQSNRLLAGIMTAAGARTRPVEVSGSGTFDGRMLGRFRMPRVQGQFAGRDLRAWDVNWGAARTALVIEDGYVDLTGAEMEQGNGRMQVSGRFSLGFPRRDGGEELRARVQLFDWPLRDLRHAFALDAYPVDGPLSGDFHLDGLYRGPHGYGRMRLGESSAYREPIGSATSALRFDGAGVHLEDIEIDKGGGRVAGTAYVGWDGRFRFQVEGRGIPLPALRALTYEGVPLTGQLRFTASGDATFRAPRYDVRAAIDDLYVADEGVGQLTAQLSIREQQLFIEALEIASSRLAVSGTGRLPMDDTSDADLTLTFANTSLDPYVRAFSPTFSPFTSAVGSGALRVVGPLDDRTRLRGDLRIDALRVQFIDYQIRNDGPVRLVLANDALQIDRMRLVGEGTRLDVAGDVRLDTERISIRLLGDANLGLLQGVISDVRASGSAEVQAEISGPWASPVVGGSALLQDGRLRYGSLPHSVEDINGQVRFDTGGASLEGVTARLGGGPITFGGRVTFAGLSPREFNVTATGYEMRIRYPEGVRSLIDAQLALRGPVAEPTVSGSVQVRDAVLTRSIDTSGTGVFGLAGGGGPAAPVVVVSSYPLRFDIRVTAESTLRIANGSARLVSSADLTLRGTYDRPQLFGRAEIERGEVFFEGQRYRVRRGVVDFSNPTRIEPFFDIEAETRAQVPGQIYIVTFRVSGTPDRFVFDLSSDPPLNAVDIMALLFGDVRDPQNAELRALRTPNQTEQDLIAARAARLLASPIAQNVGRVAEQALGVDSVQITPSLGDLSSQQSSRLSPGARLTIGKRISERLYLTYAQLLTSSQRDQLILLEFTQSDRLSWIVSQNEDDTYAVDVRVRHIF